MSSTQVDTAQRTSFDTPLDVRPPSLPAATNLPVPVAPPRDPLSSRIKASLDTFKKSPVGAGLGKWLYNVGAVAGYVVPVAVLMGAGYAIGSMSGVRDGASLGFWMMGVGAGAATIAAQGEGLLGNIKVYKKANHPYPRLASFRDMALYVVGPTILGGWLGATYIGGEVGGILTGLVTGAITSSIGLTIFGERKRRV